MKAFFQAVKSTKRRFEPHNPQLPELPQPVAPSGLPPTSQTAEPEILTHFLNPLQLDFINLCRRIRVTIPVWQIVRIRVNPSTANCRARHINTLLKSDATEVSHNHRRGRFTVCHLRPRRLNPAKTVCEQRRSETIAQLFPLRPHLSRFF